MHRVRGVKEILNLAGPGRATELLPVVAAALIDHAGRVLVQQRPQGKPMAGLWEFPGGKLELGETPEVALARELCEELGIIVMNARPLTFASAPLEHMHLVMLLYVATSWQGQPRAIHASAIDWVEPADLDALAMPSADYPLIASIAAFAQRCRE